MKSSVGRNQRSSSVCSFRCAGRCTGNSNTTRSTQHQGHPVLQRSPQYRYFICSGSGNNHHAYYLDTQVVHTSLIRQQRRTRIKLMIIPNTNPVIRVHLLSTIPITDTLHMLRRYINRTINPYLAKGMNTISQHRAIKFRLRYKLNRQIIQLRIFTIRHNRQRNRTRILNRSLLNIIINSRPLSRIRHHLLILLKYILIRKPKSIMSKIHHVLTFIQRTRMMQRRNRILINRIIILSLQMNPRTIQMRHRTANKRLNNKVLMISQTRRNILNQIILRLRVPRNLMIIRMNTLRLLLRIRTLVSMLMNSQSLNRIQHMAMMIKNIRTKNKRDTIRTRIILILLSTINSLLRHNRVLSIVRKLSSQMTLLNMLISSLLINSSTRPFNNMQRTMRIITILINRLLTLLIRRLMNFKILRQLRMVLMLNMLIRTTSTRRNQNIILNRLKQRHKFMTTKDNKLSISLRTNFLNMRINRFIPLISSFQLIIRRMSVTYITIHT